MIIVNVMLSVSSVSHSGELLNIKGMVRSPNFVEWIQIPAGQEHR